MGRFPIPEGVTHPDRDDLSQSIRPLLRASVLPIQRVPTGIRSDRRRRPCGAKFLNLDLKPWAWQRSSSRCVRNGLPHGPVKERVEALPPA
eukprot:3289684-Amphidinium_carterae.1